MNINITSRNVNPSEELIHFIKQRLEKLLKYDSTIMRSNVVLLKESRAEKVKLIITSKHARYITKCYSSTFEKTISNAIKNIKSQIRKKITYKSKSIKKVTFEEVTS